MESPEITKSYQDIDRIWSSLLRISEAAHTATSIGDFIATVHDILAELVNARNFFIGLYDETTEKYFFPYFRDEYDNIETTGVSFVYDECREASMYDLSGTLSDYVRRTGKPIRFPSESINRLYESGEITLFGSQSLSWLGVPLILGGNTMGVMAIQSYDRRDAYSAKDEELMFFVSDHIARAIENVRAEEEIRKQHQMLLQQKQAITSSIRYARRIQKAVLPSPAYLANIFPEHFTFYRPKDIISGDFYWAREIDGHQVIIVADSTGHGVPGALMSMLGVTLLNEQFRTYGIRPPDVILWHLRNKVKEILVQEGTVDDQKDGMDMAILIIDKVNKKLQYAGANIPLFLVRKKGLAGDTAESLRLYLENDDFVLYRISADRQPIGIHWEEKRFTGHEIELQERDSLYLFTDGFTDQFGGKKRKKFKAKKLKKLLLSLQQESMEEQGKLIGHAYERWRGNYEQIDDVCAFGVRLSAGG